MQWVLSVDLVANEQADANVVLSATDSWQEQGKEVQFTYDIKHAILLVRDWRETRLMRKFNTPFKKTS